jgi:hypothetical protein
MVSRITKKRGGVVTIQDQSFTERHDLSTTFSTQDILWALGIWTVILGLSPVIVFYMLMVA